MATDRKCEGDEMPMPALTNSCYGLRELAREFASCKDGRKWHYYKELITGAFYGATWEDDRTIVTFLSSHDRQYSGMSLWDVWVNLDHGKTVNNEETVHLAYQMVRALPNNGIVLFDPERYRAHNFAIIFPEAWKEAITYITRGKVGVSPESFRWFNARPEFAGKMEVLAPFSIDSLIEITNNIGEGIAAHKISLRMVRSKMKQVEIEEAVCSWLEVIPCSVLEKLEANIKSELSSSASFSENAYYRLLLRSRAGNDAYRLKAMTALARDPDSAFSQGPGGIRLGRPFVVPANLNGRMLSVLLSFLAKHVKDVNLVEAVPTEDIYKVRTIEMLVKGERSLYLAGLEARRNLELARNRRESRNV
jgi:hypothetical protein